MKRRQRATCCYVLLRGPRRGEWCNRIAVTIRNMDPRCAKHPHPEPKP